MIDEAETELLRDLALQGFQLLIDEFNHPAGFDIDQVIVMTVVRSFIARAAIAEIMALQDARFLEQAHGPVNRGDRDSSVDCRSARMQRLDIGMILRFRKHARDDAPLLGNPQTFFGAKRLYINLMSHPCQI